MSWRWFHQWGSPRWFYERAGRWQLVCGWLALTLLITGSLWGLALAPVDYQQGNSYRIIYLRNQSLFWRKRCMRLWPSALWFCSFGK